MIRGRWGQFVCDHAEEQRTSDNRCRACENERKRSWRSENIVRLREYDRQRQTPDRQRNNHLRRKYGISLEIEREMFARQGGICPGCQQPMEKAHVDHDHETGIVRALLCNRCNWILGIVSDDSDRLRRLADYVDSFTDR